MAVMRPLNDRECLSLLHKEAKRLRKLAHVRAFAQRFQNVGQLIRYIRRLKQRDDLGELWDGPRLACQISQRARFAPNDPNCFERTLLFLTLAPLIDRSLDLSSASMLINEGWHTFPVELRQGLPGVVVLDPLTEPPINAMSAAAYQVRNANPAERANIAQWFLDTARNACFEQGTEQRFQQAIGSLRNSLITGHPLEHLDDVAHVLAVTAEDAKLWGARGRAAFNRVHNSVRNLSFDLDRNRVGKILDDLIKSRGSQASSMLKAAMIAQFGPAAAIALQGMDLAVDGANGADNENKSGSSPNAARKSTPDKNDSDKDDSDSSDSDKDATQTTPMQRLRRMTLAFR